MQHRPSQYRCDPCEMTFRRSDGLRDHVSGRTRRRGGESDHERRVRTIDYANIFSCTICGESFGVLYDVLRHSTHGVESFATAANSVASRRPLLSIGNAPNGEVDSLRAQVAHLQRLVEKRDDIIRQRDKTIRSLSEELAIRHRVPCTAEPMRQIMQ